MALALATVKKKKKTLRGKTWRGDRRRSSSDPRLTRRPTGLCCRVANTSRIRALLLLAFARSLFPHDCLHTRKPRVRVKRDLPSFQTTFSFLFFFFFVFLSFSLSFFLSLFFFKFSSVPFFLSPRLEHERDERRQQRVSTASKYRGQRWREKRSSTFPNQRRTKDETRTSRGVRYISPRDKIFYVRARQVATDSQREDTRSIDRCLDTRSGGSLT